MSNPELLCERHVDAMEHLFDKVFRSYSDNRSDVEAFTSEWAAQEPARGHYLANLKGVV